VPNIAANDHGLVEENIFRFFRRDPMPLPVLLSVGFVPLEASASVQRVSSFSHTQQYTIDIYRPA
jgi:hypothetical protein